MRSEDFSLYAYCKNCNEGCCKGTPRISKKEKEKILKKTKKDYFRKEALGYYVTIRENGFCKYFKNNKCLIQHAKPIDCMLYPIDSIYNENGGISFVIETKCPASKHLTKEFVKKAKRLGRKWIKESTKEQFKDYWKKYKKSRTIKKY